jgi:hypothetical protein
MDCQILSKPKIETDEKSRNEMAREKIERTIQKHVKFGYSGGLVFASVESMRFLFEESDNRRAAVSEGKREKGLFIRIDRMGTPGEGPVPVYLKALGFPVLPYKQIFKNKDRMAGVRYPVTGMER